MNDRWQPAHPTRGLLLAKAGPGPVASWVRRGLVVCQLLPLGAWTAVLPVEDRSRAEEPYDDAMLVLAGRPLPRRLRPGLAFFVADQRAVAVVQPGGFVQRHRWVVWEPGTGRVRLRGLELARPRDLAVAAGRPTAARRVAGVVADGRGDAGRVLTDLMTVLRLPGAELLGPGRGRLGQVVAPTARAVGRFDARMAEVARHLDELEGNR